jgi:hypothetical protein
MLRIDVDSASPYAIPLDNPFVGAGDPLDEIWAFGFRNPFRFSFDSSTGDIWIGDVGQGDWEEVDVEPAGSSGGLNYGWRCYEGDDPFNLTDCGPEEDYTFPVHSYDHSGARCSVIGGFVYRGSDFSSLIDGYYFFSDFCSGDLYSLRPGSCPGTYDLGDHGSPLSNPTTFGEGFDGEIYVGESDGDINRIEATGTPSDPAPCVECPASPSTICRQPGATKASLYIKNDVDEDAKDRLTWKWLNGEPTPKSAFGDPDPANYALCLYGSPEPIQIDIPGVATCPSCWTETASGFKYKAASGAIGNVLLKGSDVPGKSRVVVKGKDTGLPDDLPTIPVEQPITVQLHNSDDECWDATYSAPATKNENQIFRDKSDE